MMLAFLEPLNEKWLALSKRDQQAAIALSVSLLLAVVVFGIILPISNTHKEAEQNNQSARVVLTELTTLAPQAMSAGKTASAQNRNSLNTDIRRQAARQGVEIQRFEPDGELLKVWLEDVRYPSVVRWLGALEAVGIEHSELTMEDRPKPGLVSVRVTFGYGG